MPQFACIFDLDGVLVDTAKYHYLAWKSLANELGFDLSEKQNESLKGVSRVDSLDKILHWGRVTLPESQKVELLEKKNIHYLDFIEKMDKSSILPGSKDFLQTVKKAGYKMALGSASKNAKYILQKVELYDYFESIIDGNKTIKGKPDPEVFIKAADELKVAYKNCIVFEDAEAGIEAAHRAGMFAIGIGNTDTLKAADFVVQDLSKLNINRLPFYGEPKNRA